MDLDDKHGCLACLVEVYLHFCAEFGVQADVLRCHRMGGNIDRRPQVQADAPVDTISLAEPNVWDLCLGFFATVS